MHKPLARLPIVMGQEPLCDGRLPLPEPSMRPSHFHARHAAWLFAAALAGCAAPAAKTPMPAVQAAKGYLADPAALHMAEVLPAAPKAGSARYEADRQVFRDTRKLEGTPRWALATSDVNLEVPDMLRDFSCAMGVTMD